MATFETLPGIAAKVEEAERLGFDPGQARENETYWDSHHSIQKFENGIFFVTQYVDAATGEDRWDVDYVPDTADLLNGLKSHFSAA